MRRRIGSSACGPALLLAWGCLLLFAACGAPAGREETPGPATEIAGIEIHNELGYAITEVMIRVPATGDFVGCGNILARSSCATTFPLRQYRGNPIQVDWKEYGSPNSTGQFVVEPTRDLAPGEPARIEVVVYAAGKAGARLARSE